MRAGVPFEIVDPDVAPSVIDMIFDAVRPR